jgi:hypothetical protein
MSGEDFVVVMSGEDFENVDAASTEAVCGDDDCVCEELFPQFTFACADGEGYVPRHACDACKGYVYFDDKHGEVCGMSVEQYEALKRQEETDMLENLKHIWDDWEEDEGIEGDDEVGKDKPYDLRCLVDSDEEEDVNQK